MIQRLSEQIKRYLAAGEMIQDWPAVARELIENALDAGATRIRIDVDKSMHQLRISDNGCGILFEDLPLVFERFATSKIVSLDDLQSIQTLGFRGEALASLCSVAEVCLTTRTRESDHAWCVRASPKGVASPVPAPGALGTEIVVRHLFDGLPVRARFLPNASTSISSVAEVVRGLSCAHPSTAFSMTCDGRVLLNHPISSQEDRLARLLPDSSNGIPWHIEENGIKAFGMLVPPPVSRPGFAVRVIVQNRPVQDGMIRNTVRSFFQDSVPAGRSPLGIVIVQANPLLVDVTIHPTKAQVRWKNASLVENTIRKGLQALRADVHVPKASPRACSNDVSRPLGNACFSVGDSYWVSKADTGLILIDQHAMDERLKFDALLAAKRNGTLPYKDLNPAFSIEVDPVEATLVSEAILDFQSLGFDVLLDERRLYVQRIPACIAAFSLPEMIQDVCFQMKQGQKPSENLLFASLARIACRTAVKSGVRLTLEQVDGMLRSIEGIRGGETCPHGRPTFLRITTTQLAAMFGR